MITRMSELEDFTIRTGQNTSVTIPADSNGTVAIFQREVWSKTQDAPAGTGKGTVGGMRVNPNFLVQSDGVPLVQGDRLTSMKMKTGPDGLTGYQNIYAYVCNNNNQNYNNVIVGRSRIFDWPSVVNTSVLIQFGENGVEIDPETTYTILFSGVVKEAGEVMATSDCKSLRVALAPVGSNTDQFCCLNTSFNVFKGYQVESTFFYTRGRTDNVVDGIARNVKGLLNSLSGRTFDVTSNTDVQKALGAIITALGGTATNVPS